jgi:hypothetical protein
MGGEQACFLGLIWIVFIIKEHGWGRDIVRSEMGGIASQQEYFQEKVSVWD